MDADCLFDWLDIISDKTAISDDELNSLIQLAANDNEEIRSKVAELLVLSNNDLAKEALIHLCNDSDELVRTNACDSLSVFSDVRVYEVLKNRLFSDESSLVKRYALLSIVDIMCDIGIDHLVFKNLFRAILDESESAGIALACYKGLYLLGEQEYLDGMIESLTRGDYQDRCATINELTDVVNEQNGGVIKTAFLALLERESSAAVRSTIATALDKEIWA